MEQKPPKSSRAAAAWESPARKCRSEWNKYTSPAGTAQVLTHTRRDERKAPEEQMPLEAATSKNRFSCPRFAAHERFPQPKPVKPKKRRSLTRSCQSHETTSRSGCLPSQLLIIEGVVISRQEYRVSGRSQSPRALINSLLINILRETTFLSISCRQAARPLDRNYNQTKILAEKYPKKTYTRICGYASVAVARSLPEGGVPCV